MQVLMSSDAIHMPRAPSSFSLLVARPGAPSSVLLLVAMPPSSVLWLHVFSLRHSVLQRPHEPQEHDLVPHRSTRFGHATLQTSRSSAQSGAGRHIFHRMMCPDNVLI